MTDANLVRVLQSQTRLKVGLLRYDTIAQGAEQVQARIAELRAQGVGMAIADALPDSDLYTLGSACADLPLLTGGSGLALGLPENFRRAGKLRDLDASKLPVVSGGEVVLAGSASIATNGQVAAWLEAVRPDLRIDPLAWRRGSRWWRKRFTRFGNRRTPLALTIAGFMVGWRIRQGAGGYRNRCRALRHAAHHGAAGAGPVPYQ